MASSHKPTVALDAEEMDLLDTIRQAAPRHGIDARQAQAYGIWTVCFRRFCEEEGRPWLWMDSVSSFMDYLEDRPDVSSEERDRALDGIMFYITDVHRTAGSDGAAPDDASAEEKAERPPGSTKSLFARLLMQYDLRLTAALRLRRHDVDLTTGTLTLPSDPDHDTRQVRLSGALRKGLTRHLDRVQARSTDANPRLFGRRALNSSSEPDTDSASALATRVMQTLDTPPPDA
jgi:hypothetical protein